MCQSLQAACLEHSQGLTLALPSDSGWAWWLSQVLPLGSKPAVDPRLGRASPACPVETTPLPGPRAALLAYPAYSSMNLLLLPRWHHGRQPAFARCVLLMGAF